jgi:hypothetical protein
MGPPTPNHSSLYNRFVQSKAIGEPEYDGSSLPSALVAASGGVELDQCGPILANKKCYKGNWVGCHVRSPDDQFDLRLGFDRHRRVPLFLSAAVCAHSQLAVAHRWRACRLLRSLLALGRLHQRQDRSKAAIRPTAVRDYCGASGRSTNNRLRPAAKLLSKEFRQIPHSSHEDFSVTLGTEIIAVRV